MKHTPIGIARPDAFLDITLQAAPRGMAVRELLVNAFEARPDRNEKTRQIRFEAVSVAGETIGLTTFDDSAGLKLSILNSGQGLSSDELRDMTNVACEIDKQVGLTGTLNRGEGGKIATLNFNRLGIRYRSRHNGVISEVVMFHHPDQGWVRETQLIDDVLEEVWTYEEGSLEAEEPRYSLIKGDWTEVLLCGNTIQQETWMDVYGDGLTDKATVPYDVFARFYRFPEVCDQKGRPMKLTVWFSDHFRNNSGKGRLFYPVEHVIQHTGKVAGKIAFPNLDKSVVDCGHGVKLHYVLASHDDSNRTPYNFGLGRNGSRSAIIWNNEMYDVVEQQNWSAQSPQYGLHGLGKSLSVFIELADDSTLIPSRYREALINRETGHVVSRKDFQDLIIRQRPKWVLKLLEDRVNSGKGLSDVQSRLERLAQELATRGFPKSKDPATDTSGSSGGSGGKGGSGGSGGKGGGKTGPKRPPNQGDGERKGGRYSAPPILHWTTPEEEDMGTLDHRAAEYVRGTNILFLNSQYPLLDTMVETICSELPPEAVDNCITDVQSKVKEHLSYTLGATILHMHHKTGQVGWGQDQISNSLTPVALTSVAEACRRDIPEILLRLNRSSIFKSKMKG